MSEEETSSFQEIVEEHRGRYVAIEVTERDASGQPLRGRVVEVYFDKHKLRDRLRDAQDICILYAGPTPKEGFVAVL